MRNITPGHNPDFSIPWRSPLFAFTVGFVVTSIFLILYMAYVEDELLRMRQVRLRSEIDRRFRVIEGADERSRRPLRPEELDVRSTAVD
jgi:hypothetical protein